MRAEDVAYFEHRAEMAVEQAQRATCRAAVRAHYEMSKAYLDTAEELRMPNADGTAA